MYIRKNKPLKDEFGVGLICGILETKVNSVTVASTPKQIIYKALSTAMLAVLVWCVAPPPAEGADALPAGRRTVTEATSIEVIASASQTTFKLHLSEGVPAEIFTLANPYRVIIDLPEVAFKLPAANAKQFQGLVAAFRYGLFAEGKGRVVVDTAGPVKIKSAGMARSETGVDLTLVLSSTDPESFGAGTGSTRQAQFPEKAAPELPAEKPVTKLKPVIVIDPGHGGIDPGAVGVSSVAEKSIVLAVAIQLKAALSRGGVFDVKMTRSTDVFVSLDRRLKISADHDADLFISLHADSIAERDAAENIRGATIYTLSERASDEQARLMAEKENKSDLIAGLEAGSSGEHNQVKSILIDLLKRETSNFSADFSHLLADKLKKSIMLSRAPQRSAAFKVLKQSHAASVLIELGYMSNSKDQEQMGTIGWQKQVAMAISAAVEAHFSKRTAEQP